MKSRAEPWLKSYAVRSAVAGGRVHEEPDDSLRCPFEVDRHRIIESTAFRRLEQKTQVFTASYHDHFRTRLTHTLEVTELARTLAARLGVNETLTEAIALAHDLGHPPFGHAGEAALNEAMADYGGFNHNTHSLRVVDYLEHPFPQFRGLNLTLQTRAGLALHETRYDRPDHSAAAFEGLAGGPGAETQVASIADRIAVIIHDLEDAIGAGLIGMEELARVELWSEAMQRAGWSPGEHNIHAIRRPVLNAVLDLILGAVVAESRIALGPLQSPEEVRLAKPPVVLMPNEMASRLAGLEEFLLDRVYKTPEISELDAQGRRMVGELFESYLKDQSAMPPRFAQRVGRQGPHRVIGDYIAGMTDRLCATQYEARCAG